MLGAELRVSLLCWGWIKIPSLAVMVGEGRLSSHCWSFPVYPALGCGCWRRHLRDQVSAVSATHSRKPGSKTVGLKRSRTAVCWWRLGRSTTVSAPSLRNASAQSVNQHLFFLRPYTAAWSWHSELIRPTHIAHPPVSGPALTAPATSHSLGFMTPDDREF